MKRVIEQLNDTQRNNRIEALKHIAELIDEKKLSPRNKKSQEVNNHIHTWYSFSPYSPAMAVYKSWDAGLAVCGIVDHESIAGAEEMKLAGKVFGIGVTVGCELKVDFRDSPFSACKLNSPDMEGLAYNLIHGISANYFGDLEEFLKPLREARYIRNEVQTQSLSKIMSCASLPTISFEKDVIPESLFNEGGSITERHMLYALAKRMIEEYGKGSALCEVLENKLTISISQKIRSYLTDESNPHYEYDLLGLFKTTLLDQVFIKPNTHESIDPTRFADFAKSIHAIPAYSYLGDVTSDITGDKNIETFEDEYLDELFEYVYKAGYLACTYVPPRNTVYQLRRVSDLCKKYNLMEISGVDINSSRQGFVYKNSEEFIHLNDSAWALVAHEDLVHSDPRKGIFSDTNTSKSIRERVQHFAKLGRQQNHTRHI